MHRFGMASPLHRPATAKDRDGGEVIGHGSQRQFAALEAGDFSTDVGQFIGEGKSGHDL